MSNFQLATLRGRKVSLEIKAQNTLSKVINKTGFLQKAARFAGFLLGKVVNFFNLDFSDIWSNIVEAYFELKHFDFNATDEELNKQIARNNQIIAVAAAESLGELLPYGAIRLANFFIGRLIGKFSRKGKQAQQGIKVPVLAARIDLALAEEGADELRASVKSFVNRAGRAQLNNMFIAYMLKARQKQWLGLQKITEPREDGSIYGKIQKRLEKLPKFWQEPAEEFIESIEDAVQDIGYVLTYEITDHMAAIKAAQQEAKKQPERVIEITPSETTLPITFSGPQDEVQQAITTLLPVAERLEGGDTAVPEVWSLKPGAYIPQLAIALRTTEGKTAGTLHIPHYTGERKPVIPSFTHGSYITQWVMKDNSKIVVYTDTEKEGQKVARAMGRYVDKLYRLGQPITQTSNRRVKRKKVKPVTGDYYPTGAGGESDWRVYF